MKKMHRATQQHPAADTTRDQRPVRMWEWYGYVAPGGDLPRYPSTVPTIDEWLAGPDDCRPCFEFPHDTFAVAARTNAEAEKQVVAILTATLALVQTRLLREGVMLGQVVRARASIGAMGDWGDSDPEDVVAPAFAEIRISVGKGGGPRSPARPWGRV